MVKGAKRIKHAMGAGQLVRQREKLCPVHSDGQYAPVRVSFLPFP